MNAKSKNKPAARKNPSNELREGQRIEGTYHLANMARWTAFCFDHMAGDRYAEIAEACGKSKAWWKLVSQRQWRKIKPTPMEYRAIQLLYRATVKFGGDTRGRRNLAVKILRDMATLQNDIAEMMKAA